MIPLGVLAGSARVGGLSPGLYYVGAASTGTGTSTRTFSNMDLGGVDSYARTVIVVSWRHAGGGVNVSSVTVGGSAATERAKVWREIYSGVSVHDIATPSASADVVVELGVNVYWLRVAVYLLVGSASLPAYSTSGTASTSSASSLSTPLTLPSGGAYVIAGDVNESDTASALATWSGGVTLDDNTTDEAYAHMSFASGDVSSTSPTITATWPAPSSGTLASAAYTRGDA